MRELEQWIPDGVDNADFHELSLGMYHLYYMITIKKFNLF